MDCCFETKYLWLIVDMNDTAQPIKNLHLKLWLEKKPEERLMQFLNDNDAMFKAILKAKKELGIEYDPLENYRQ